MDLHQYKQVFLEHLKQKSLAKEPVNLYQPINYVLNLGGKRLRPILTLMSCQMYAGDFKKALDAALAVEMFHNFSLVHDDIMDAAPLRRGRPAVHEKWNLNTGILSGDAMLVLANQLLETYQGGLYRNLTVLFNKTAIEVCEGQQFDFDFETREDVSVVEYLEMIRLKTAVLVGASLKFGGIIGSAPEPDLEELYQFGLNLGIAFQLQDDYLDVFGTEDFGKQKAGDILENKKTFLYLKTLEVAENQDRSELLKMYRNKNSDEQKIERVTRLLIKYGIPGIVENSIQEFTNRAIGQLQQLSLPEEKIRQLEIFACDLMERKI